MEKQELKRAESARLPYAKPRLVKWGDLRTITLGGGGKSQEPGGKGAPKTKGAL